jgi:hypothetical protein
MTPAREHLLRLFVRECGPAVALLALPERFRVFTAWSEARAHEDAGFRWLLSQALAEEDAALLSRGWRPGWWPSGRAVRVWWRPCGRGETPPEAASPYAFRFN